jgi:hypothetical protein
MHLLALPMLPAYSIVPAFDMIVKMDNNRTFEPIFKYMRNFWFKKVRFEIKKIMIYNESTNRSSNSKEPYNPIYNPYTLQKTNYMTLLYRMIEKFTKHFPQFLHLHTFSMLLFQSDKVLCSNREFKVRQTELAICKRSSANSTENSNLILILLGSDV